jgi:TetR/AcrR family transcriptional regulator, repressor of fatR-cypB operon
MAKNKPEKAELQDDILKAALRLFTEKGYFNTSVADINQETGISTGSIYHHFHNKEAIAKALYHDLIDRLNHSIDEIRRTHKTTIERARAVVDLMFTLTEQAPEVMQFILFSRHQEFLSDEKPMSSAAPFEKLCKLMLEGMKSGEIRRMDPRLASACFFGVVIRVIQMHLDGVLEKPLDEYSNEVWKAAWRTVDVQ